MHDSANSVTFPACAQSVVFSIMCVFDIRLFLGSYEESDAREPLGHPVT